MGAILEAHIHEYWKKVYLRQVERRDGDEGIFERSNGLRKKEETAVEWAIWIYQNGGRAIAALGGRKRIRQMHMWQISTSEESRPNMVGECKLYRKEREDLEEEMRQKICDTAELGKLER